MRVNINTYSSVKTICGFSERELEFPERSSVHDIMQKLFNEYDELGKMKGRLLFALNEEYCEESTIIRDGDSLAVFPPVSGG